MEFPQPGQLEPQICRWLRDRTGTLQPSKPDTAPHTYPRLSPLALSLTQPQPPLLNLPPQRVPLCAAVGEGAGKRLRSCVFDQSWSTRARKHLLKLIAQVRADVRRRE